MRVVLALAAASAAVTGGWQAGPPLPVPRTEVAAAVAGTEIVVAGGYLADGQTTARVDLYDPVRRSWRQGPDLPRPLNHAAAASLRGSAVLVGGYADVGNPTTTAVRLDGDAWRPLPPLPQPRAAAGAAALNGLLYVVGGVAGSGLAHSMLRYDPVQNRWAALPGPTPRQHLAAAAARGRIYAIGGRITGANTNVDTVESWAPGEKRWRREPSLPEPRGGTGAAVVHGVVVSVGSEAPEGTSGAVYAFDVERRSWSRLPDLPTPRHGLGVVAFGREVIVIGGGPQPGLTVTGANESLNLSPARR
jgi:non-specific serine/threonine protein kinase